MIDYNADNSSNRYLNGGETPNNYAAFYNAEDIKVAEGTSSGYGNTGLTGTTLNNTLTSASVTYFGISSITSAFQNSKYFSFRVSMAINSPLIRLNRFRIGVVGTFGTNSYDSNLGYNYKLDVYDESTSTTTNLIADNATSSTINNTNITFTLLPGRSYVFKIYLRNTNGRTNTYIDNPTLYGYAIQNTNTANYTACSSGTVSSSLSTVVSSGTPNNMQLRWLQGSTNVSGGTISSGTYTPYYFNNVGNCYHPAGSSVAVTTGTTTSISSQPSPNNQTVCLNNASVQLTVSANGTNLIYQWYSNLTKSSTGGTPIAGATSSTYTPSSSTLGNVYYYVVISGSCGTVTSNTAAVNVVDCVCYNNGNFTSAGIDSNLGITSLMRAGQNNNDNWPMIRKSAHMVLESTTKGFILTRVTTSELTGITNPQEGMIVYDLNVKCLKVYSDGSWKCFSTPSCP